MKAMLWEAALAGYLLPEGLETWDFQCAIHCYYRNTPGFPQALFSSLLRAVMLSEGADLTVLEVCRKMGVTIKNSFSLYMPFAPAYLCFFYFYSLPCTSIVTILP